MYVLSASAQAADRDQEVFPIKKRHTEKYCHMCEETYIYGSIFWKEIRAIHFQCNDLNIYSRQSAL